MCIFRERRVEGCRIRVPLYVPLFKIIYIQSDNGICYPVCLCSIDYYLPDRRYPVPMQWKTYLRVPQRRLGFMLFHRAPIRSVMVIDQVMTTMHLRFPRQVVASVAPSAQRPQLDIQSLLPSSDRKSTRLNSSHLRTSRMPSSA